MESKNRTIVTEIIILGFAEIQGLKGFLFGLFMVIYVMTVLENVIILAVIKDNGLSHAPMYFFLSNFSSLEILYTTVTVPKMLENMLSKSKRISLSGCIAQVYLFVSFVSIEYFLLAVMAYDRYIAICNPLHYSTIMTSKVCSILAFTCWFCGFLSTVVSIILISQLDFCGPNVINHFFCDISPLISLACEDIRVVEITDFIAAMIVLLSSVVITVISYTYIICTILRIPSKAGRKKAFSTCASHLVVVLIFYITTIFTYARPQAIHSFDLNKFVSALYSIVTPMFNPFVYTLRNKDVKDALRRSIAKLKMSLMFKRPSVFINRIK
ncbi:olfactory receptor 6Y1-like [Rhinatrema bivittatum]|uniref:olfactory receptor 6Y1-like n=1 Tax=Rhinatrema bivittatum TaxID=194408 RepID=UPI001129563A|nr:olfactory receptor 6Y1-like [Rhinatrema bivittatum]